VRKNRRGKGRRDFMVDGVFLKLRIELLSVFLDVEAEVEGRGGCKSQTRRAGHHFDPISMNQTHNNRIYHLTRCSFG
jgi:hypothetical protein